MISPRAAPLSPSGRDDAEPGSRFDQLGSVYFRQPGPLVRTAASGRGAHQLARPSSRMNACHSTPRTRVGDHQHCYREPGARHRPLDGHLARGHAANRSPISRAAAVTNPPLRARADATVCSGCRPTSKPLLADARQHDHLVVHGTSRTTANSGWSWSAPEAVGLVVRTVREVHRLEIHTIAPNVAGATACSHQGFQRQTKAAGVTEQQHDGPTRSASSIGIIVASECRLSAFSAPAGRLHRHGLSFLRDRGAQAPALPRPTSDRPSVCLTR